MHFHIFPLQLFEKVDEEQQNMKCLWIYIILIKRAKERPSPQSTHGLPIFLDALTSLMNGHLLLNLSLLCTVLTPDLILLGTLYFPKAWGPIPWSIFLFFMVFKTSKIASHIQIQKVKDLHDLSTLFWWIILYDDSLLKIMDFYKLPLSWRIKI